MPMHDWKRVPPTIYHHLEMSARVTHLGAI